MTLTCQVDHTRDGGRAADAADATTDKGKIERDREPLKHFAASIKLVGKMSSQVRDGKDLREFVERTYCLTSILIFCSSTCNLSLTRGVRLLRLETRPPLRASSVSRLVAYGVKYPQGSIAGLYCRALLGAAHSLNSPPPASKQAARACVCSA